MIKVTPLFSGSKGNCCLLQFGNVNLLLDAGFGYKQISAKLSAMGIGPKDVAAIVITHEHGDHISALPMWTKHCPAKIYAPRDIADYIRQRSYCSEVVPVDESFGVQDVFVETYPCSHDAICCFGYRFTYRGESFASVTDTGTWTQELVEFLAPCKTVLLESNHDVDMVRKGSYPYPLKRRILSPQGHLSNEQTAELIERLIGTKVQNIILAHLSENNNTKELAFDAAVRALAKHGVVEGKDVNIYVATQGGLGVTVD
ncbi:MAG: MBL fold metallo-hydrolase [Corallococcus sp.]|nr:MBL fold metallo-hydrolase [Corallococcus sp.]MCM1395775.1 MBL fold metallo-hydrolase [Corallococcus sp.]